MLPLSRPAITLALEGNIGAGKSTFLKMLGNYFNAQLVPEPHEQWQQVGGGNLLDHFYKDTKRWAYTFQTYAFVTRVVAQQEQARTNTKPLQILERSVFSDRYCFAQNAYELGFLETLEWQLYQEWFSWLVTGFTQKPDAFIYIRTTPEVCYNRINKRSRSEESGVSMAYLESLHAKHEAWLVANTQDFTAATPVLVLDGNLEFENALEVQHHYRDEINAFLMKKFNCVESEICVPLLKKDKSWKI
jgi:deoxyadenosine/deoxycytidine kinase